jgi:ribosomal protein L18
MKSNKTQIWVTPSFKRVMKQIAAEQEITIEELSERLSKDLEQMKIKKGKGDISDVFRF